MQKLMCSVFDNVFVQTFQSGVVLETDGETRTFPWAQLALGTSVSMTDLVVEACDALPEDGGLALRCTSGGAEISVRTEPLYENGVLIPPERFPGKAISLKGVVDFSDGAYLIRVLTPECITIDSH